MLVNVTLHDTDYAVQYSPLSPHRGRQLTSPWITSHYSPIHRPRDTFHHTSIKGKNTCGPEDCQVSFEFTGAQICISTAFYMSNYFGLLGVALYMYGAPKVALDAIVGGEYPHGHQEVCINHQCHAVDSHQLYLNLDPVARHHPVLLWFNETLSASTPTHVTFKRIEFENRVGQLRGVSFERATYTEVRPL